MVRGRRLSCVEGVGVGGVLLSDSSCVFNYASNVSNEDLSRDISVG